MQEEILNEPVFRVPLCLGKCELLKETPEILRKKKNVILRKFSVKQKHWHKKNKRITF